MFSSEYLVLHGARALALPTRLGQRMKVQELSGSEILWSAYDVTGKKWFSAEIDLLGFEIAKASDPQKGNFLRKLLRACCQNNSEFLSHWKKYKVDHYLEFPLDWGLGSSSTLIYNMARWADVNPYHLYFDVASGSGYDIACAGADGPLIYSLGEDSASVEEIDFNPSFTNQLYFLPLNHKTDSQHAVEQVRAKKPTSAIIDQANALTEKLVEIRKLDAFEQWVRDHEQLVARYVEQERTKSRLFSDFWGEVKSLGAWGGDLLLVSSSKSRQETEHYFKGKGYPQLIGYEELIL
ncbi:MAG: GHMP kinase [Saprospiraceae bacterium]|nr:GHMP kinase [Saprospiraceae bacterium]